MGPGRDDAHRAVVDVRYERLHRRLERGPALPRRAFRPEMAELDPRHGPLATNEFSGTPEPWNEMAVADGAAAAPPDLGRFHDHQAGAARGERGLCGSDRHLRKVVDAAGPGSVRWPAGMASRMRIRASAVGNLERG